MILDYNQSLAVNTTEDNVIVVASAGSGKTRVLTSRVEKLILDGVNPHEIVCITFTNMAASEMRRRLSHLPNISEAFIGTIHSFANQILRGSGLRYSIRSTELERSLTTDILKQKRAINPSMRLTLDKYLQYLDYQDLYLKGKVDALDAQVLTPSERNELSYIESEVDRVCQERSILSFYELILRTRQYFESAGYSLSYLLVDEFQDVGRNEYNFLRGLKARSNFYVGDPRQAIYGFKGGDVRLFTRLMEDPDFTTYELVNNYRNCTNVISDSSKVAQQMNLTVKSVVPVRDAKGQVDYKPKHYLKHYLDQIAKVRNYGEWFILTWSNKDLYEIHDILQNMNIPTTLFKRAGLDFEGAESLLSQNTVKLMTVHVSKGLESPNVIMYGNFSLVTPSYRKFNIDDRKVMYVGMTRAIDRLIVLS